MAPIMLAWLVVTGASLLACALAALLLRHQRRLFAALTSQTSALAALHNDTRALAPLLREESRTGREELRAMLGQHQEAFERRLGSFAQQQNEQLAAMRTDATAGRTGLEASLKLQIDTLTETQSRSLGDTSAAMNQLAERLERAQADARQAQKEALETIAAQIKALTDANELRQEALRQTLDRHLQQMRGENEAKLEQMRQTVDEKLQGTLETRLGESFKLVSDRLEQVHRGLGEMQNLATGVGDLKRVLGNVKSRGGWGEMQLGMLLQDLLTVEQYGRNVRIRPESNENVEFAVRLPGGQDDMPLWLPIDSKFPQEDYERLLAAQDAGLADNVEKCATSLERAIRAQAKLICDKYVHPPFSTDFAIMYLPTEGLFAEVVRRPGLCSDLQASHRVMLTGPTTLAALLTSLQMGFRTLAIEKRSSEVWQVLGAAKAEFQKYGQVWDKLGKQLDTAKRTVEEAGKRTRAVERRLRDVETIDLPAIAELAVPALEEDENDETGPVS